MQLQVLKRKFIFVFLFSFLFTFLSAQNITVEDDTKEGILNKTIELGEVQVTPNDPYMLLDRTFNILRERFTRKVKYYEVDIDQLSSNGDEQHTSVIHSYAYQKGKGKKKGKEQMNLLNVDYKTPETNSINEAFKRFRIIFHKDLLAFNMDIYLKESFSLDANDSLYTISCKSKGRDFKFRINRTDTILESYTASLQKPFLIQNVEVRESSAEFKFDNDSDSIYFSSLTGVMDLSFKGKNEENNLITTKINSKCIEREAEKEDMNKKFDGSTRFLLSR